MFFWVDGTLSMVPLTGTMHICCDIRERICQPHVGVQIWQSVCEHGTSAAGLLTSSSNTSLFAVSDCSSSSVFSHTFAVGTASSDERLVFPTRFERSNVGKGFVCFLVNFGFRFGFFLALGAGTAAGSVDAPTALVVSPSCSRPAGHWHAAPQHALSED